MNYSIGAAITREQAQALALSEAEKGAGFVSPNPLVGCVIVDSEHRFLSSGYHAQLGGDHAEVAALKKVSGADLSGATVYVTLEPCAHHGRTPPCADRLALESLKAVIIGLKDPDPRVSGRGIQLLKNKNIHVEVDNHFGEHCKKLSEIFLWHVQNHSPFVALKIASSFDGQMALKSGESQWITSEASRLKARALRARYDATLVGARTFLNDDPWLDFRGTEFEGRKQNRIVIWDPSRKAIDFFPRSQLGKMLPKENVIFLHEPEINRDALQKLYKEGLYSLFVEGGGHTISQFLKTKQFNTIYQFVGPSLMGNGIGWSSALAIPEMSQKIPIAITSAQLIGEDVLLTADHHR